MMLTTIFAAEAPNGNWIPGDINEFWWGLAAFSIIVAAFLRWGLPAIRQAMKNQADAVENELAEAKAAEEAARAEFESVKASLGNVDEEAARIVQDGREQADRLRTDLIARADAEVAEAMGRATIEIAASRESALADLRAEVANRASVAADAVVRENLDASTQSSLIDRYIDQVASSGGGS